MVLEFESISKSYDGLSVLDNVSVRIDASSRITCIKGESGAGKTTFLSLLAGAEKPSSGRVKIDGFLALKPRDFAKIRYVPCDGGLLDALSVKDNILFAAGESDTEDARKSIVKVLESLGVLGTYGKYPPELSSGEYKRVQIATMLFAPKNANIIDEPTANLDSNSAVLVRDAIKKCADDNPEKLFVVATHDEKLLQMAGRILEV